jgi:hypothetical protein
MPKKKRGGFTGTGQKYPQRQIVNTRDAGVREAFYATTDADAPLDARHIAAGYLKHPESRLYQVWISTNGLDFTPLAAFREEAKAGATVSLIQQEVQAGHFSDPDLVHEFYRFLEEESDGQVQLFPDDLIRKLGRDLLHSVIALPEDKN